MAIVLCSKRPSPHLRELCTRCCGMRTVHKRTQALRPSTKHLTRQDWLFLYLWPEELHLLGHSRGQGRTCWPASTRAQGTYLQQLHRSGASSGCLRTAHAAKKNACLQLAFCCFVKRDACHCLRT